MKRPVRIILLFLLSFILLFLLTAWVLPAFLKFTNPVATHNILIESWISAFEIEQAVREFGSDPKTHFYLVGMEYQVESEISDEITDYQTVEKSGIWLYTNSSLVIKCPDSQTYLKGDTIHVSIEAKGQQAGGEFAHFNVAVDGQLIGGSFSTENEQEFIFQFILPTEIINSMAIRFNNDLWTETADRNLHIGSVKINDDLIFPGEVPVYLTREQNQKTSGFYTQADEVANYLMELGIGRDRITIIRFDHKIRNKTREASLAFNNFAATRNLDKIYIVTSEIHSRRTWVTYSKILGRNWEVGVIYFPDSPVKEKADLWNGNYYLAIYNEFFSYLANWITLILLKN